MADSYDIALQNNDLVFQNGDLVIAKSDQQHIEDTINAFPGWWKQNPTDGVGIFQYLNSSGKEQEIARKVILNLKSDGYDCNNPDVITDNSGNTTINPYATKL